jgi:hypothetical protein
LLRSLSIVNPFHIPRPEAVNIELQDFSRYWQRFTFSTQSELTFFELIAQWAFTKIATFEKRFVAQANGAVWRRFIYARPIFTHTLRPPLKII